MNVLQRCGPPALLEGSRSRSAASSALAGTIAHAMNRWTSDTYRSNAAYVPALGAAVFELLNPQPGERILDLGCGEGSLTEKIAAAGATVVGVDASAEM